MSTHDFDVVVVGGGIAGLVAANRAAEQGMRVALLERGTDEQYPCNTRYSGGIIHLAFHNVQDPPEKLLEAIMDATDNTANPALANALATTSGRSVEWLQREGVKFIRVGNIVWQQWALAPPRPIAPGLIWKGRGPDYMLRTLAGNLASRGGSMFRGMAAQTLLERNGGCTGVRAIDASGEHDLRARAVVLADGGFQGNLELLAENVCGTPVKLKQRGASTGIGDGLRMARALGADLTDLRYFYGHILARDAFTNDRVWPYPQLDELGTVGIVTDSDGHRIADEGRGGIFVANVIGKLADPLSTWAIFDDAIWDGPGRTARIPANPHLANGGATILQASSLAELAGKAGIPADNLQAVVKGYNDALEKGRADTLSPPRTSAKVVPMPIRKPPFYAIPLCAGITYTFGGMAIDEHGRCLGASRRDPIEGLYAVGATTGGLEGGNPGSYVGGLLKGLVFGLRAAEHIGTMIN